MRKKPPSMKQKRVQTDKTTSAPPLGVPSWCLNEEALKKLNRPTDNIQTYDDYDSEDQAISNNDSENITTTDDESRETRRRKTNNNEGRQNKKRKKNSKQKKRKNSKRSKNKR